MMVRGLALAMATAALLGACSSSNGGNGETRSERTASTTTPAENPSPEAEPTAEGGPTTVSLEDRLEAELTIDDQPDWMASGYGSIWVAVDEAGAVDRIDPTTNEVVASIKVGNHPCDGMAAGFGSIWVPSCSKQAVYRISPARDKVEAVIKLPVFESFSGTGPFGGLGAGAGAVWMVTEGKAGAFDILARIDPGSNEVTDEIQLGHLGGGVAVGGGSVWVSAPEDGVLVQVDPRSRRVVAEVTALAQPSWVAADDQAVWVLSATWAEHPGGDGSVARIDPATGEIVARIRIDESPGEASDIAVGGGFVWARSQFTLLAKIDPATNTVVERYEDRKGLGGVEVGFGSVWLSDFSVNRVWRLPL
jgi:virginiamycin B lyase